MPTQEHVTGVLKVPSGMLPGGPQEHYYFRCSCGHESPSKWRILPTSREDAEHAAAWHASGNDYDSDSTRGRAGVRAKGWRA